MVYNGGEFQEFYVTFICFFSLLASFEFHPNKVLLEQLALKFKDIFAKRMTGKQLYNFYKAQRRDQTQREKSYTKSGAAGMEDQPVRTEVQKKCDEVFHIEGHRIQHRDRPTHASKVVSITYSHTVLSQSIASLQLFFHKFFTIICNKGLLQISASFEII